MESETESESESETEMTEMEKELQIQEANRLVMEEKKMILTWLGIDTEMEIEIEKTESQMEARRLMDLEYKEAMEERKKTLEESAKFNFDHMPVVTTFGLGFPDHITAKGPPILLYGTESKISSSFKINVSSVAIERFRERLFGDQERCTNKLVYLCLRGGSSDISWLAVNANAGPTGKEVSVSCVDECGFPSDLTDYGCAVWNASKIIIAGGKCEEDPSDKVFIFDTISRTWEPPLRMNTTRGEKPTVIVADSKIFVFGGENLNLPWAEVYDDSSRSWHHLPAPDFIPKIISHAVYQRRNQILFWLDPCVVLSFNYRSWHWEKYDKPMSIAEGPQWSATVVVFEDFLIWHHFGTIYAHDLLNDVTIPMYTLSRTGFYSALFSSDAPPGFPVHIGRGKLCLFYQVDNCVRYIIFLVQISECVGPTIPHTVVGRSGFLETPPVTDVNHALEISS